MLEKTLESPLDCKEIQPVHPTGDQSWVFIGGTDAKGETLILCPPYAKSWLIGKDPDAGKDWGQEEKGTTEDKMVGWHHRLNGHGFGWTPGVGDGQGGLVCCSAWDHKESDTTERLNWTEYNLTESFPRLKHFFDSIPLLTWSPNYLLCSEVSTIWVLPSPVLNFPLPTPFLSLYVFSSRAKLIHWVKSSGCMAPGHFCFVCFLTLLTL